MRRFLSYSASQSVTGFGLLLLRLAFGGLLMVHGYDKLTHYNEYAAKFMPFMGLSPSVSLTLVIFAELVCAGLVVLGLLTRFAIIPILITMCVALFKAHGGDYAGEGQAATLFGMAFLTLLFTGPGKYSVDAAIYKH